MAYRVKKNKTRKLWINVKVKAPGATRAEVRRTLIDSVRRGDYKYPDGWYVQIEWRNKESAPMRIGEWETEMNLSKRSSSGFDKAVINYLRGL